MVVPRWWNDSALIGMLRKMLAADQHVAAVQKICQNLDVAKVEVRSTE
jgi:hypothetical protein